MNTCDDKEGYIPYFILNFDRILKYGIKGVSPCPLNMRLGAARMFTPVHGKSILSLLPLLIAETQSLDGRRAESR